MSDCTDGSSIFRPIKRFASKTVFLGLIATCADGATLPTPPHATLYYKQALATGTNRCQNSSYCS